MANELAEKKQTLSEALTASLTEVQSSLPQNFNIPRFVQNSIALLNGNEALIKFNKQYGSSQIKAGLMRAAYLGLDALHSECYLVPYGSTINFVTSYTGMMKMVKKYSQNKVRQITTEVIRDGDSVKAKFADGRKSLVIDSDVLSTNPVKGVIAMCIFDDGSLDYEYMSVKQLEDVRKQSKAKNSLAWSTFTEEMYKKVVVRRLCKRITLDLDVDIAKELDSGIEIETDQKELARRDIAENENSEDFIESTAEVVMD